MQANSTHTIWKSHWTFCLAIASVTVGLQLVWTMPTLMVRYGGSGFVLVYLLALVGFAAPLLGAEIWLGREGRGDPAHTIRTLQTRAGLSRLWRLLGPLNIVVSVLVLSYLTVVGGWALAYGLDTAGEAFMTSEPEYLVQHLSEFLANSHQMVRWFSVFLLLVVLVSGAGVNAGIGFAARLLLPLALLILLVLLAHNVAIGAFDALQQARNLFVFGVLNAEGIWAAVTLAFFSLSPGLGAVMACSAYMPERQVLSHALLGILLITAVFSVLIGLVIVPVLLHSNVEIAEGAPLLLLNLPLAFSQTVHGDYYGALFFALTAIVAFTTAIMLLEPLVAWLQRFFSVPRYVAAVAAGAMVWLLTLMVSLSFNEWSGMKLFAGRTPFRLIEAGTAHLLIPLTVILNGWMLAALLRQPRFRQRYSAVRVHAARLHLGYVAPLVVGGLVWFSVRNKWLF